MTPSPLPPSRAGKRPVTTYVDKDLHKALRRLGVELDKSNQEMLHEALLEYLRSKDPKDPPQPLG